MFKHTLVQLIVAGCLLSGNLRAEINISNFRDGEIVAYPLVIIKGTTDQEVAVMNRPSCVSHRGDEFRVLLELVPGKNHIIIQSSLASKILNIELRPPENDKKFAACYFVPETGDMQYQTSEGIDEHQWKTKIQTALKMMQSFIAEDIGKMGVGKRTIHFVSDHNLNPTVIVVRMPYSVEELHSMDKYDLHRSFKECIKEQHIYHEDLKFIAIPSFTRGTKGHLALGGSYLASYSSIALQCWPKSTETIYDTVCSTDPLPQSMYEYEHRRNVSTQGGAAIGCLMHEVGHCLGLTHDGSRLSIMWRGYERFYSAFVLNGEEEPSFEDQRMMMICSEWVY